MLLSSSLNAVNFCVRLLNLCGKGLDSYLLSLYRQPATTKWYDTRDFVYVEFCVADSKDVKVDFGKKKCGFRYAHFSVETCTWIDCRVTIMYKKSCREMYI